jgi:two-component system sensor histidine kinase DesK
MADYTADLGAENTRRDVGEPAESAESAGAVAPAQGSRRSVYLAMVVWLIWLLYMIPVIGSLLDAHPSAPRLIGSLIGAALFIAIYVWVAWQNARRVMGAAPLVAPSTFELWLPIAALLALSIALTAVNGPTWGALFIYTCAGAGGRLQARPAAALLLGVALMCVLYGWRSSATVGTVLANLFTLMLATVTTIAMMWSVTWSRRLREERAELARYAAVTEERLRIARDLHDLLGHNLSLIALKSELAGRLVLASPERAAVEIGDIERVARTALQEVREAVAGYRQPTLASELRGAREVLAAAGIAYRIEGDETLGSGLPTAVESVLAWAVREGITNVVRHSRARTCEVGLDRANGEVSVSITDDGPRVVTEGAAPVPGPLAAQAGNGLRGLAERVAASDGCFEAGPLPGGGFRLSVVLPLERRTRKDEANGVSPVLGGAHVLVRTPADGGDEARVGAAEAAGAGVQAGEGSVKGEIS